MRTVNYLSKAEHTAINSNKDTQYFVTQINVEPHTHPLYIGRCIREHEDSLGLGAKDNYYSSVIAIWEGDIYEAFEEVSNKLTSNKKWIQSYQWELEKKFKELKQAVSLYEDGYIRMHNNQKKS